MFKDEDGVAIWTNTVKTGTGIWYLPIVDTDGHLQIDVLTSPTNVATGTQAAKVSIGSVTAVELTFTGTTKTVMIQASYANTDLVYVGRSDITNTGGGGTMVELGAGRSVTMNLDDASAAVYAIAASGTQSVYKSALT